GGSANANLPRLAPLKFDGHLIEVGEERLNETIKPLPGRRQREGPALEERHAQILLQLGDLAADRRLLDAVGNVAHGLGDSAMASDVIEEFEMVNVHRR